MGTTARRRNTKTEFSFGPASIFDVASSAVRTWLHTLIRQSVSCHLPPNTSQFTVAPNSILIFQRIKYSSTLKVTEEVDSSVAKNFARRSRKLPLLERPRSQSCVIFSEPGAAQSKRNCGQFIIAVARRRRRSALAEKRREKGNDGRTAVVSQRERNYKCYPRDVNSTGIEIIPRPRRRSPRLFINSHCSLIPSTALPAMPLII